MRNPESKASRTTSGAFPFLVSGAIISIGLSLYSLWESHQSRASAESTSPGNIRGHGYVIDASVLNPTLIRVTGRKTIFPWQSRETSLNRGLQKATEKCGEVTILEDATERSNPAATSLKSTDDVLVIYGSVPNRLACLGK